VFENNYFTEMCSGSKTGSYLRLVYFCITQRVTVSPEARAVESEKAIPIDVAAPASECVVFRERFRV